MGINAQNQEQVIAHIVKLMKDLKLIRQSDNIGVNVNGEKELAVRALVHFDTYGKIDVHALSDVIKTIRVEHPTYRDDFPYHDDQQLKEITSIEAARALSVEQLRMLTGNIAFSTGLNKRFNERCAWLQANGIHETKPVVSEPVAPVIMTPQQQAQADARKRLDAVYAKIDKAGGHDWQQRTIQFRAWLKNKVKELIAERRGIGFIEKTIDDEIHDQEIGSIR